jgi:hypothetical protein
MRQAEQLYREVNRARAGRPILSSLSGPEYRALQQRCQLAGADPAEVVLAVAEQHPISRALAIWGAVTVPTWFLCGPKGVATWAKWRDDRAELRLGAADTRTFPALRAQLTDSEHRITLLAKQGMSRDEAATALLLTGVLAPVWVAAHKADPSEYPRQQEVSVLLQESERDSHLARFLQEVAKCPSSC